jgi:drug/metabolite transporter (DMT)-like permease
MSSQTPKSVRFVRLQADLILLAVALVWGSGFAAGRVAANHLNVLLYNGARFLLGGLVLLPLAWRTLRNLERIELWGGVLGGLFLLGAANAQQLGLRSTTAAKAGFITGLYVVIVPLLLALIWRQRPRPSTWIASVLATAGLFLLSDVGELSLAPGDAWEVVGAVLWASHLILVGMLARRVDTVRFSLAQFLICGTLSALLGLSLDPTPLVGWAEAWWAVVYNGVLSVGLAFTLQTVGQRFAPATDAAVILSLESVFAALFGWLLLGEILTSLQVAGCGLMLGGMLLAQVGGVGPDRHCAAQ